MEVPSLDYINSMARGDLSFLSEILTVIQEELPTEHMQYCNCINNTDWEYAASLVHKMKHKFTIFGLKQGVALANKHELMLRDGNADYHNQFVDLVILIKDFVQEHRTV